MHHGKGSGDVSAMLNYCPTDGDELQTRSAIRAESEAALAAGPRGRRRWVLHAAPPEQRIPEFTANVTVLNASKPWDVTVGEITRPFAVDYAVNLGAALNYTPSRSDVISLIAAIGAAGNGGLSYYNNLRSDGFILAGSAASGNVFVESCSHIHTIVQQLLGPVINATEIGKLVLPDNEPSSGGFETATLSAPPSPEIGTTGSDPGPEATLSEKIRALEEAHLTPEVQPDARRAISEAALFVDREIRAPHGSVSLSEDGIVTLKWEKNDSGVLLIFAGDGAGTYAISVKGSPYGVNYHDFDISDELPIQARRAIEEITEA